LRARHADGGLPLLWLPAQRDDLECITQAARRLVAGATDVVLLGDAFDQPAVEEGKVLAKKYLVGSLRQG
jgi:glucose-6-phosphate isomerase